MNQSIPRWASTPWVTSLCEFSPWPKCCYRGQDSSQLEKCPQSYPEAAGTCTALHPTYTHHHMSTHNQTVAKCTDTHCHIFTEQAQCMSVCMEDTFFTWKPLCLHVCIFTAYLLKYIASVQFWGTSAGLCSFLLCLHCLPTQLQFHHYQMEQVREFSC